MNKVVLVALFFVFAFAYFLRILYLPKLSLTFGYDQARDAYISQQILSGDLKIIGPPASTPGLHHGVFYYYIIAPAYFFGKGNPIAAAYWIAFLNSATTFLVFCLTYFLTKESKTAILASILYAVSFEASQYATWLSNPTIGIWTVPLIYLGLWLWISKEIKKKVVKNIGALLAAIGLGLSIQANIFLAYHLIPFLLWLWVSRKNIKKSQTLIFLAAFFVSISSMLISEFKFGFRSLTGITSLLTAQDRIISQFGLGDFLVLFINQIGRVFSLNTYPGNVGYGGTFVLVLIFLSLFFWLQKGLVSGKVISWQPFLVSWLLAHISVVSVGGASTPFLLVGIGPAVSVLLAIFLVKWWSTGKKALSSFVLLAVIIGSLTAIFRENPKGQTIFAIQKDMLLSKQLELIDYTYRESGGEDFSVNSLTSPLWINIVWTYLYKWYGSPKYGYIPTWHGRDQVGQLDSLPNEEGTSEIYYLILEPMAGIPGKYLVETTSEEDSRSELITEKHFGELVVQKRIKRDNGSKRYK